MIPAGPRMETRMYRSQAEYQQDAAQWLARGWRVQGIAPQYVPPNRTWVGVLGLLGLFPTVGALCIFFPLGIVLAIALVLFVLMGILMTNGHTRFIAMYVWP